MFVTFTSHWRILITDGMTYLCLVSCKGIRVLQGNLSWQDFGPLPFDVEITGVVKYNVELVPKRYL